MAFLCLSTLPFVLTGELEELFSGRIRGIEIPSKQGTSADTTTNFSAMKRKRESMGDEVFKKRRDSPVIWKTHTSPSAKVDGPESGSRGRLQQTSILAYTRDIGSYPKPFSASHMMVLESPPYGENPPSKTSENATAIVPDISLIDSESLPSVELRPPPDVIPLASPITSDPALRQHADPPPRPQLLPISLPPSPRSAKQEMDIIVNTTKVNPFITFLDKVSPRRPVRFLEKGLWAAGISTVAELKIIAHQPEEFREKIPALNDLRTKDQYLWMRLKKNLVELLDEDDTAQLADEDDPIRRFVCSLRAGDYINMEWFTDGLKKAGISSQKDLLVISRNLERYAESISFLRVFTATHKFGWIIFQVGLEGLPGSRTTPTSIQTRECGADKEDRGYVKQFLDTIDPDKPLGHLADGFIRAGLSDHFTLLDVAEDIKFAVGAMPFLQDLASGDQFVWAMIVIGLETLLKPV